LHSLAIKYDNAVKRVAGMRESFEYILLLTKGGPFYDTTVYALYVYRRAFESGQYGYGAALALFLIVIGVAVALLGWRFFDMERLLQRPRIEVQ
jgi:inositol-phosphate transport system permease protein